MEWIAADDVRCHDENLRPVLSVLDAALRAPETASGAEPASIVVLVRSLATAARVRPEVRTMRLREVTTVAGRPKAA